jgi:ribose transport system substrate-binding protein
MRNPRAVLALLVALTVACNRPAAEQPAAGGSPAAGKPRVALVLKTLNSPYFIEMQRGAQAEADRIGATLVVQAAEREVDVEKQMQIIENLIQTKVGALAITPSGSKEIVPAIQKANAAGIPVVVVDTRVDPAAEKEAGIKIASFIGSDNYDGGKVAGRHLVEISGGKATVGLLEGIPGHETGDSRLRGFKDAVKAHPGIRIVASQTANWERDQGFTVFQNMLQAHKDIDTLFACNDMMALGAVEAIEAAGKTGKIRVIGFDAVDDAKKAMQAGTMVASVAQFPAEMGKLAVASAVQLIKGETPPADQQVRIELVTKANATTASK